MSNHSGSKPPLLDGAAADQAWLERAIRHPIGAEPPSTRRPSKGPRRTLTPPSLPSFEAVAVPEIPPAPVADFSASTVERVPVQLLGAEEARALRMDHRAGFILSLVDGVSDVEAILDLCAMPRAEALRILQELGDIGAIALR